jgi:hypothetical protein
MREGARSSTARTSRQAAGEPNATVDPWGWSPEISVLFCLLVIGCGYSTGNRPQAMLGFVVVVPAILTATEIGKLAQFSRNWGARP